MGRVLNLRRYLTSDYNTNSEMLDLTNIRQISAGDETFVKGVLEVFLTKEKEYTESIQREWQNKNYFELRQAVHKIKSSISVLGMSEFKTKLNKLEAGIEKSLLSDSQIEEGVEETLSDFSHALTAVRAQLQQMS